MRQFGLMMVLGLYCSQVYAGTFSEGLWKSQDPRIYAHNGYYYSVHWEGNVLKLYKSQSLIDRGVGKVLPANFPISAPFYVGTLNGTAYNIWAALGVTVWTCPSCSDPYDDIAGWVQNGNLAIPTNGSQSFDFEVFQNPQPGPYQNNWYLVHAGADPSLIYSESIYISQILSLTDGQQILANPNNTNGNRIITYESGSWTDIIDEAPGVAVNSNNDVFVIYSGNGTQTDEYSLGIAVLQRGQDPSQPASWINHNQGGCEDADDGPSFEQTSAVWGPGVAKIVKSPDGSETWMIYHSKTWSTYNTSGRDPDQNNNEMYNRYESIQKIFYGTSVKCNNANYLLPTLGSPVSPGVAVDLPSGDPGVSPHYTKIEAEAMIPFGYVMGPTVQALPRVDANPEVLTVADANCSNGAKQSYFDALANDVPTSPKQSGLIWYNAPGGSYLTITAANPTAASFDLYVAGTLVGTMNLPPTGSSEVFVTTQFTVNIGSGDEVRVVYQQGKNAQADIDFIEMSPTQISVPSNMTGGTTAAPSVVTVGSTTTGGTTASASTGGSTATGSTTGTATTGGTGHGGTTSLTGGSSVTGGSVTGSSAVGGTTGVPEPEQVAPSFGCSASGAQGWAVGLVLALWTISGRRRYLVG